MATATSSTLLSFPSQEVMTNYLNNHPRLANDDYLRGQGIVGKITEIFANTKKTPEEVENGMALILKSIGSFAPTSVTSLINIERAIQDCAAGKIFRSRPSKLS